MKMKSNVIALLCAILPLAEVCAESPAPELKAGRSKVIVSEISPDPKTPKDVLVTYYLAKESGDIATAAKYLSKNMPDRKRKECLERSTDDSDPLDEESISFRLKFDEGYTNEWIASLGANLESGAYQGVSYRLVWEDDQWKLK
ncbi:hypothetical protein [Sulfuriroseicoccus oceanibius]|uniref:Uncharacterized protein n=1 Tax=Sulfuriroseicoccus oceanibius TaxID=2707525 RepID=A0A6B3LBB2_9BACT|nr:hypothetical protein [Sulfuriroseicoccus oceanibius]QQL44413.1 hypothetical protein G3M56_011025 [Sulfuriroseicoccus oceanibius]